MSSYRIVFLILILISAVCLKGCSSVQTDEPTVRLEKAVAESPGNINEYIALGTEYEKLAQSEKSILYIEKAIDVYSRAKTIAPSHLLLNIKLYDLIYRQVLSGNSNAEKQLEEIFAELPQQSRSEINPPSLAKLLSLILTGRHKDTSRKEINDLLLKAISEQPSNALARSLFGNYMLSEGRIDLAIGTFKGGLKANPENARLQRDLGIAYGEYVDSQTCPYEFPAQLRRSAFYLNKSVKEFPDNADIRYGLISAYERMNLIPLSINEAKRLTELEPTDVNRLLLASLLAENSSTEGRQIIEDLKNKNFLSSYAESAFAHAATGDFKLAMQDMQYFMENSQSINIYHLLLESIARLEENSNQQIPANSFSDLTSKLSLNEWELALRDFWLEKKTAEALFNSANNVCELTEANFYIGYKLYKANNHKEAISHFKEVKALKAYTFKEYKLTAHFIQSTSE